MEQHVIKKRIQLFIGVSIMIFVLVSLMVFLTMSMMNELGLKAYKAAH